MPRVEGSPARFHARARSVNLAANWSSPGRSPMSTITTEVSPPTTPVVTIAGSRATIRLNRPAQHNRLEPADLDVLHQAFERIDADSALRVLVITGTGK